jgi:hypothetical protein
MPKKVTRKTATRAKGAAKKNVGAKSPPQKKRATTIGKKVAKKATGVARASVKKAKSVATKGKSALESMRGKAAGATKTVRRVSRAVEQIGTTVVAGARAVEAATDAVESSGLTKARKKPQRKTTAR